MISPDSIAVFIAKWRASTLKERSAAQEHFIDLCRLLGVKTPAEEDPHGEWYCFEKGAKKTGGGDGWADVWKRGHFGWEYKGKGKSLRRPSDTWLIDFGNTLSESKAALYENPFEHVLLHVKPSRTQQRDEKRKTYWWRLGRSGAKIRSAIVAIPRYIATPMVAKHRLFVWLDKRVFPDQRLIIIARDDDTTFGILHSRVHELWALRTCTWLGKGNDPRYTPTTCFETFPFPVGLTPNIAASDYADDSRAEAIAAAARRLNDLRENWRNPPQWVDRIPEIVPGYPDRLIPKPEFAAELKKRTLLLHRLLKLNQERAGGQ